MSKSEKDYLKDMLSHFIQDDKESAADSLNRYLELKAHRKLNESKEEKEEKDEMCDDEKDDKKELKDKKKKKTEDK